MTQRLVEQGGDHGLASSNLGGMYFVLSRRQLELENLAEAKRLTWLAIENLRSSLEILPGNGPSWGNLGNCLKQLATMARAEGQIERVADFHRQPEAGLMRSADTDNQLGSASQPVGSGWKDGWWR